MSKYDVCRQTFDNVTTQSELQVVFHGDITECEAFCDQQAGFVRKPAMKQLFGVYWYNQAESVALLVVNPIQKTE